MFLQFFCAICHEEYKSSDQISTIRCGHVFHQHCLTDWFSRSPTCPDCRAKHASGDLKKIFITSKMVGAPDVSASSEPATKLNHKVDVRDADFHELQYMHDADLKELQYMLDESEENYDELQKQFDSISKERKDLLREKQRMQTMCRRLENELDAKQTEIQQLRKELETTKNKLKKNSNGNTFNNDLIQDVKKTVRDSMRRSFDDYYDDWSDDDYEEYNENPKYHYSQNPNKQYNQNSKKQYNQNHKMQYRQQSNYELNVVYTPPKGGPGRGAIRKNTSARLDNAQFSLFKYAKRLEKVGFKRVFYEDNEIYAWRNNDYPEISIYSRDQVDDLMQRFRIPYRDIWQRNRSFYSD